MKLVNFGCLSSKLQVLLLMDGRTEKEINKSWRARICCSYCGRAVAVVFESRTVVVVKL